jgi:hypothetical protein
MIPVAVGETASEGRAVGDRPGIVSSLAGLGVGTLGKDAAFSAQLRQSWQEELTEQSDNLSAASPSVLNAEFGSASGPMSSSISGRISGLEIDLDSEVKAPEGAIDQPHTSAQGVANGGAQSALGNAKPSTAARIAPQHAPLDNRPGEAVRQHLLASVRSASPDFAYSIKNPTQLPVTASSAGHPVHRRSSHSESLKASMPSPSPVVEVAAQNAAAEQSASATQTSAPLAARESSRIVEPLFERSGPQSSASDRDIADSPREDGFSSFSLPGAGLPAWLVSTPAGLAGQAVLQPLTPATGDEFRMMSTSGLPTSVEASPPPLYDSRKLPHSDAEILPSSTPGGVIDRSPLATAGPGDQNRILSPGVSPIAAASAASTLHQAARLIPEAFTYSNTGPFAPPISANAASAMPHNAPVSLASPSPQAITGLVAGEPHPVFVRPSVLEGVRQVETQSAAPSLEYVTGNRISTGPELDNAENDKVAASPLRSAESPIALASVAAQTYTPAIPAQLPLGADARTDRSNPGPSRQPDASRPTAISSGGSSPIVDAGVPGTQQIAHILPNVAPNTEGRTDLPAWTNSTGRGEANPNPFQVIDAAHMPNAATTASAWPAPAAGHQGAHSATGGSQLQVGYQDPVLGYVELRAHSDGNGVHASLGTQTESGRAALSGDLSALAAWMDARHTPVESLSVVALHGASNASSSLAGGRSGHEEFGGGQSAANGGSSELDSRSGAGPDSGSSSGHPAGNGSQSRPDAVPALLIGQRSGFGPESSPPIDVTGIGRDVGSAPEDGFAIGSSISILA